jgi:uncharacterized protein (DUF1684 family)
MRMLTAAFLIAFLVPPIGYKAEVEAFRKQREAEIGGETGWAALTGLHWLSKGDQTVGRATSNTVVLTAPSAPDRIGTLTVSEHAVVLHVARGVAARVKGNLITQFQFEPNAPIEGGVTIGGMRMIVIERGSRLGLRVWDRASPSRLAFKGLHWYAIDQKWRVEAKFVPHQPAPKARVANVLGEVVEMTNPGSVVFVVDGRQYELEALLEESGADELFFMFRDATSARTTYGTGRYLYTPLPKDGRVTLDFNRAMNPPCAFTDFATCPLPLEKNRLKLAVEAGELQYKGHPN